MSSPQPFRPPAADTRHMTRPAPPGSTVITQAMVQSLSRTRPWALFLGVIGMILAAFMVVAALLMIAGGSFAGLSELEGMDSGFGAMGMAVLGGFYLLLALFYFFPSLYLLRYGMAIGRMGGRADSAAMEKALAVQHALWRFLGVGFILMILLYFVGIAVFVAITVSSAGS